MPSQTLPAEEVESLRQSILDGDPVGAIRRYRRALPDAPLAEANGFVGKLSAELAVKYPEKFAPLKPWNLNWRAMGICLILGVVVFAWVWTSNPPASPAARLAELSAGFIICAGACFSLRLKARWGRWLYITFLVSVPLLTPFFQSPVYYFGGCVFGASMMVSGFTRKRRKTAPRI
jgi:hypothetical protein